MLIRDAGPDDAEPIASVYGHYVEHTTATFDTEAPGEDYWRGRIAEVDPTRPVLIADDGGAVLGFAYAGTYRPRPAYDHTRETSIYLAPTASGRGVGSALYADLLARLDANGVHTTLAVIARPNPASEALHRAHGFEPVGVLPQVGHKFGRWVDTEFWARRGRTQSSRARD